MRKTTAFIIIFGIIIGVVLFVLNKLEERKNNIEKAKEEIKTASLMKITSPVFENNQQIPKKYTCDGEGVNPPLAFSEIPQGTKSFVLIVEDPDAPIGIFVHWIVYNIDVSTTQIKENSVPQKSMQGLTSINKPGYVPPCPPSGKHRYIFNLFALDSLLDLSQNVGKEEIKNLMQGHILAQTQLESYYSR